MMAEKLLAGNPDIRDHYRQKFQYILVDEFQDTSPAQMKMVQALAWPARFQVDRNGQTWEADSYCRLMVVGDQKQSIYGWRDARPENLDELLPFTEDDKVGETALFRPLTITYRMDRQLTVCANCAAENTGHNPPRSLARSGLYCRKDPGTCRGAGTVRLWRYLRADALAQRFSFLEGRL